MSDVSWSSSIRSGGTVAIDASSVRGAWSTAITHAISDLNALFSSNQLSITLTRAESAIIVVALTSGRYTFSVDGTDYHGTLQTNILHGATRSIDRRTGNSVSRKRHTSFSHCIPGLIHNQHVHALSVNRS